MFNNIDVSSLKSIPDGDLPIIESMILTNPNVSVDLKASVKFLLDPDTSSISPDSLASDLSPTDKAAEGLVLYYEDYYRHFKEDYNTLMVGKPSSWSGETWSLFKNYMMGGNLLGEIMTTATSQGHHTGTMPSPGAYGLGLFSNYGGTQLFNSYAEPGTGSLNYLDYLDIQSQMTGYTADTAANADIMWQQMQMQNKTVYGPAQRTVGGLITAGSVTPALSQGALQDQFLLQMLESRMIGAPGVNINYIEGELANAESSSVINFTAEALLALNGPIRDIFFTHTVAGTAPSYNYVKEKLSRQELIQLLDPNSLDSTADNAQIEQLIKDGVLTEDEKGKFSLKGNLEYSDNKPVKPGSLEGNKYEALWNALVQKVSTTYTLANGKTKTVKDGTYYFGPSKEENEGKAQKRNPCNKYLEISFVKIGTSTLRG